MKEKINYSKRLAKDFNAAKFLFQIWAVYFVAAPVFYFFYKVKFKGQQNIPKGKKIICAANHLSYFDPFLVFMSVNKPLAFMAKKELFENEKMAKTLDFLAAFAVNRERLEVSTIKTVKEVFKTKHWRFAIFPQGGIRKNKKIEYINKGFAAIAKASKTDILPIAISGCEQYCWKPFGGEINVQVGEPISYNQDIDSIIDEWGRKITEMNGYEYAPTEENPIKELYKAKS
ncbi:MAG: lysophospholipid acyltransferase family protein [Candidatus Gastranaerophilales bacterium]|nr:lysophospholipid acyltransferase family protein [Candidatus Gastranaerophilales bacterium]